MTEKQFGTSITRPKRYATRKEWRTMSRTQRREATLAVRQINSKPTNNGQI